MQRPNPDKLLKRAQEEEHHEERGRLKIYLGAAPGVGKTHEMLHDALEQRDKGLDVVVGVAESHGRHEVQNLLKHFEMLPKKAIEYHGKTLLEFDLALALKRHPGLILIDEMAHSNAPLMRHKKRWQDIKELLDRGIDVYTTLNVQHIESLNDDVSQIIHAPIKETVPDSMIEMADTIELVDIPPEELIKRLQEGKVYIPKQAEIAAELFFRKGNLTALRELALRVTAERVGAEVLLYRQGQGIRHIWPSQEKILVCVGPGAESLKLIRAAKRMVSGFHTRWIAVYVDVPRIKSAEEKRNLAIQNLRFAEQLGAETRILTGFDIVKEVMNFAREQNVTLIMIWKHVERRLRDLFFRNLADEILRNSGEIDVYIMTGMRTVKKVWKQKIESTKKESPWMAYGLSVAIVVVTTIINFALSAYLRPSNLIMVYLLGVTIVALMGKTGPSILATVLSVLLYDFFFIPPYYTFGITDLPYFLTLIIMLIVAQVISQLTILIRQQAKLAHLTEHQTSALYMLSRQLASSRGVDVILKTGICYIADIFECEVIALMPEDDHLVIRATCRTNQILNEKELSIAKWVYELGQKAGLGTDSLPFSDALYLPLLGSQGVIGVLRMLPLYKERLVSPEQVNLLEACANQIALALEVDRFQEQTKKTEMKSETDRARTLLLKSVSHDLRAPLIAIIGAASTEIEMAKKLDASAIEKIGKEIYYEADELNRLINNLLQINYLEAGEIKLQKQLLSLNDLIASVVNAVSKRLGKRVIHIEVPDHLPLIPFDRTLMHEVLVNLIDNAEKFTPKSTPIEITVNVEKDKVVVSVIDHGPGIMLDEINKLFEKFYRGRLLKEERGLGLGLAICRSIIKAHGGEIWAENGKKDGAIFRFSLPLPQESRAT